MHLLTVSIGKFCSRHHVRGSGTRSRMARSSAGGLCVALDGGVFTVGQCVRGHVTYTGYEHVIFDVVIERMEPERCLCGAGIPPRLNVVSTTRKRPQTLVVSEFQEADGGTLLSVVESGFENIPLQRRLEAFRMNSGGGDAQIQSI